MHYLGCFSPYDLLLRPTTCLFESSLFLLPSVSSHKKTRKSCILPCSSLCSSLSLFTPSSYYHSLPHHHLPSPHHFSKTTSSSSTNAALYGASANPHLQQSLSTKQPSLTASMPPFTYQKATKPTPQWTSPVPAALKFLTPGSSAPASSSWTPFSPQQKIPFLSLK